MAQIEVTEESLRTAVDEAVFAQAVTLADKVAGFSAVGPQIEAIVDGIEVSVRVNRRPGHRGAGRRELPDRRPGRRPGPRRRPPRTPPGRVEPLPC
jgi:hypothetical protein